MENICFWCKWWHLFSFYVCLYSFYAAYPSCKLAALYKPSLSPIITSSDLFYYIITAYNYCISFLWIQYSSIRVLNVLHMSKISQFIKPLASSVPIIEETLSWRCCLIPGILFIIWYLLTGVCKEFMHRYSRIERMVYSVESRLFPANLNCQSLFQYPM